MHRNSLKPFFLFFTQCAFEQVELEIRPAISPIILKASDISSAAFQDPQGAVL